MPRPRFHAGLPGDARTDLLRRETRLRRSMAGGAPRLRLRVYALSAGRRRGNRRAHRTNAYRHRGEQPDLRLAGTHRGGLRDGRRALRWAARLRCGPRLPAQEFHNMGVGDIQGESREVFVEALEIIRGLWSKPVGEPFSFHGRHFDIDKIDCGPPRYSARPRRSTSPRSVPRPSTWLPTRATTCWSPPR